MPDILRIDSPYSRSWCAWLMIALIAILLVSLIFQKGMIRSAFQTLTAAKKRNSPFEDVVYSTFGHILYLIYSWLILSLAIYAILYFLRFEFSVVQYLICASLTAVMLLLRLMLKKTIDYVFFSQSTQGLINRHISALNVVASLLLFPLLLLVLYCPMIPNSVGIWSFVVFFCLYIILYIIKAFQLFFNRPMVSLYIFSYLCTLEIVPLCGVLFLTNLVIESV